ncbi:MAG: alpha/beta family hydrolase [Betaproteobacteria bacterium]
MQVVALPGRRSETEAWLRSLLIAGELPVDGILRYRHWSSEVEASVAFEASRLEGQMPQLVVAKSMGTVIAATAFDAHEFRPAAAVLIGTPFEALPAEEQRLLKHFAQSVGTLFIQQSDDPGGSAAKLPSALQLVRSEVTAIPGNDHLYSDTSALGALVKQWMHNRQ